MREEQFRVAFCDVLNVVGVSARHQDHAARAEYIGRLVHFECDSTLDHIEYLLTDLGHEASRDVGRQSGTHIGIIFRHFAWLVLVRRYFKLSSCDVLSVSKHFREEKVVVRRGAMAHQAPWECKTYKTHVREKELRMSRDAEHTPRYFIAGEPVDYNTVGLCLIVPPFFWIVGCYDDFGLAARGGVAPLPVCGTQRFGRFFRYAHDLLDCRHEGRFAGVAFPIDYFLAPPPLEWFVAKSLAPSNAGRVFRRYCNK